MHLRFIIVSSGVTGLFLLFEKEDKLTNLFIGNVTNNGFSFNPTAATDKCKEMYIN